MLRFDVEKSARICVRGGGLLVRRRGRPPAPCHQVACPGGGPPWMPLRRGCSGHAQADGAEARAPGKQLEAEACGASYGRMGSQPLVPRGCGCNLSGASAARSRA